MELIRELNICKSCEGTCCGSNGCSTKRFNNLDDDLLNCSDYCGNFPFRKNSEWTINCNAIFEKRVSRIDVNELKEAVKYLNSVDKFVSVNDGSITEFPLNGPWGSLIYKP